jgi:hypothetical protein
MTWSGKNPVIDLIEKVYKTGKKLKKRNNENIWNEDRNIRYNCKMVYCNKS